MIVLTVINQEGNVYELFSEMTSKIILRILFDGINKPNAGDKILIHSDLVDRNSEIFTQPYVFTLCDEVSIDEIKKTKNAEYVGVKTKNNYYCLKRMYG